MGWYKSLPHERQGKSTDQELANFGVLPKGTIILYQEQSDADKNGIKYLEDQAPAVHSGNTIMTTMDVDSAPTVETKAKVLFLWPNSTNIIVKQFVYRGIWYMNGLKQYISHLMAIFPIGLAPVVILFYLFNILSIWYLLVFFSPVIFVTPWCLYSFRTFLWALSIQLLRRNRLYGKT